MAFVVKKELGAANLNTWTLLLRQSIGVGWVSTLVSVSALCQNASSIPDLLPASPIEERVMAPNFRVAEFRLETLDAETTAAEAAPEAASDTEPNEGLVKRRVK